MKYLKLSAEYLWYSIVIHGICFAVLYKTGTHIDLETLVFTVPSIALSLYLFYIGFNLIKRALEILK